MECDSGVGLELCTGWGEGYRITLWKVIAG